MQLKKNLAKIRLTYKYIDIYTDGDLVGYDDQDHILLHVNLKDMFPVLTTPDENTDHV